MRVKYRYSALLGGRGGLSRATQGLTALKKAFLNLTVSTSNRIRLSIALKSVLKSRAQGTALPNATPAQSPQPIVKRRD